MRTFTIFLAVTTAILMLAACGNDAEAPTGFVPGQSVEAYAYVHGGYVGQAVATTDAEGNYDVTLDEAFLPHTLAIVDMESDEWTDDNTATYVIRGDTVHVAKWIAYDGTNYVGETVGTALIYVAADDQGNPAGGKGLELTILRNEANMAAWFDNIQAGGFQILTEFGGSPMVVETTSYGSLTKRGSTYWNFGIGWEGNMDAIQEAATQYGVSYALDEIAQNNNDEWELADATTGATLSDFKDYFSLVQLAVARLEMQ